MKKKLPMILTALVAVIAIGVYVVSSGSENPSAETLPAESTSTQTVDPVAPPIPEVENAAKQEATSEPAPEVTVTPEPDPVVSPDPPVEPVPVEPTPEPEKAEPSPAPAPAPEPSSKPSNGFVYPPNSTTEGLSPFEKNAGAYIDKATGLVYSQSGEAMYMHHSYQNVTDGTTPEYAAAAAQKTLENAQKIYDGDGSGSDTTGWG